MHLLIVGAGGVGGYFGARAVEAGIQVRFLVRPARARQIGETGLSLDSPRGGWQGPVETVTAATLTGPADIVVLACKAYDLDSVLADIAPAVGTGTTILSFLNGVAHLDLLKQRFPDALHWGGVAHLGVTTTPSGTIRHLNTLDTFLFGPLSTNAAGTARARELERCFGDVAITARAEPHIRQAMWDKLVFLATLAGATCLMRADIGAIMATGSGRDTVLALLDECAGLADAEGHAAAEGTFAAYRAQLTDGGSRATASMLRDIAAGRPTEADHIFGDLLRRAKSHGLATPLLRLCLTHLQAYEATRQRSAA